MRSLQFVAAIICLITVTCTDAQHVYKCERTGQPPVYQAEPCATGASKPAIRDAALDAKAKERAEQEAATLARKQADDRRVDEIKRKLAEIQRQDETERQSRAKLCGDRADTFPQIGDTDHFVRTCSMLKGTEKINRTQTGDGVREQWIYPGRTYLYFQNGRVVAIQN